MEFQREDDEAGGNYEATEEVDLEQMRKKLQMHLRSVGPEWDGI